MLQSASGLDRIEPCDLASAIDHNGHQDAPVQASAARMESLEPVNSREPGLGIVKRQQFPVHGTPTGRRGALGDCTTTWQTLASKASLRGNVVRGAKCPLGENVLVGNLKQRIAGSIIEPPADLCFSKLQQALAEDIVIPISAFEGAVHKERQKPEAVLGTRVMRLTQLIVLVHCAIAVPAAPLNADESNEHCRLLDSSGFSRRAGG